MGEPTPWLKEEEIIAAVSAWTGVDRKDMLERHPTHRARRAKLLLAECLLVGCDMSKREVLQAMGYSTYTHSTRVHVFGRADPAEVALIIEHAQEHRESAA